MLILETLSVYKKTCKKCQMPVSPTEFIWLLPLSVQDSTLSQCSDKGIVTCGGGHRHQTHLEVSHALSLVEAAVLE